MYPAWELLWLAGAPEGAELRALARAHPQARSAPHVSRSYRAPYALIAWHEAPIGADLERVEPLEPGFGESICTPAELGMFGELLHDAAFVTSLWASKEALAKALGEPLAHDPRRLESPVAWESGVAGAWHCREFIPTAGHLAWLVWRAGSENSAASPSSAPCTRRRAGRR